MMSAVAFLTVAGGARPPDHRTLRWFPLTGAAVGVLMALVWWGARSIWPPLVAASVVVLADLVVTGMLHFDGLADSSDGLLPHMEQSRRLEIMSQPDVGAFALTVVPAVLLIRWATLASDALTPWGLVGIWAMSRTFIAIVPSLVRYARDEGLASPFLAGSNRWLAIWLLPTTAAVVIGHGPAGLGAITAGLFTCAAVGWLARRRIGGFTGDVLGAMLVLSETAALLALTVGAET